MSSLIPVPPILYTCRNDKSRLPPLRCVPSPVTSPETRNPLPSRLISVSFLNAFQSALPGDFTERCRQLVEFSKGAESKVTGLPYHLIQAVIASEDLWFFYHVGFDPYGIGRAIVHYPNGGGGSTLTQQLVKNVFLTPERKISRKFVEGILSLIVERRLSKWKILYSYMQTMYWGHGKYGIEAASLFYFGKHPSLLNIGESALLAGILPSPEKLSPITNPRRGKNSQAKVLRKMVAAGFLDLEMALHIVKQPISLHIDQVAHSYKEFNVSKKKIWEGPGTREIWDWEMATMLHESREDMENWALQKYGSI